MSFIKLFDSLYSPISPVGSPWRNPVHVNLRFNAENRLVRVVRHPAVFTNFQSAHLSNNREEVRAPLPV